MTAKIPESFMDLMEAKAFAHLATTMPDGSPQVTPVWFGFDGSHVLINSSKGRRKDKNIRRDPRVSISMCDPDNPYRYLEIRGKVVEILEEGAVAHIDALAGRYLGLDEYPSHNDTDVRVIYKIEPIAFSSH
jgi:PPOX class probable F420-dependent enzyme